MLIGLILPSNHPWRDQAAEHGTVGYDRGADHLMAASRTKLDVLLVHSPLLAGNLEAVRRYRIARPDTRIVASYPVDARPGDPTLAALVSMGVYDLIPDDMPLDQALAGRKTYADASRWLTASTNIIKTPRSWPFFKNRKEKRTKLNALMAQMDQAEEDTKAWVTNLKGQWVVVEWDDNTGPLFLVGKYGNAQGLVIQGKHASAVTELIRLAAVAAQYGLGALILADTPYDVVTSCYGAPHYDGYGYWYWIWPNVLGWTQPDLIDLILTDGIYPDDGMGVKILRMEKGR